MRHILLVDDEPEVVEGLALILDELENVEIHTACLASQALQLVEQIPVSLVFADIRMPGMNGIEMWDEIQKRRPGCRVIFLSGVRDFDNIYRAVQNPNAVFLTKMESEERILSAARDALSELDRQEKETREQVRRLLYEYLNGSPAEQDHFASRLEDCAFLPPDAPGLNLVLCGITCAWSLPWQEQQDVIHHLSEMVSEYCRELSFCSYVIQPSSLLVVTRGCVPDSLSFPGMLRQLAERLLTEKGVSLCCVYQSDIRSLAALRQCYGDAMNYAKGNLVQSLCVLSLEEVRQLSEPIDPDTANRLKFDVQALQSALLLGQVKPFQDAANHLFTNPLYTNQSLSFAAAVYSNIIALLCHELRRNDKGSFIEQLHHDPGQKTPAQLLELLQSDIAFVFDVLHPSNQYAHPDLVVSVQRYIVDHLHADLSLTALSTRFNMNPNYLSRLFHENTGQKLHEYITRIRLSKAEQLLISTRLPVNQIASQTGYDSSHTLIRAFRKQYGTTPVDYRAKNSKA